MNSIIRFGAIALLCCFAACASETETATTTTRTSQRNSTTDTTALDPTRNTNMQPSSYNSMGPR